MPAKRVIKTVFHLVDDRNWKAIRKHGLLSTKRLAAASGFDPDELRRHRAKGLELKSGARIRDQSPMPPSVLSKCLRDGLSPEDWYDLLNGKVFFWLDADRLNRQRRACGAAPQRVLVIDAVKMLDNHGARASVTPINTGNAMRAAAPRGLSTFVPYHSWVSDAWASENVGGPIRPPDHKPAELTVDNAVDDIMDYVVDIVPLEAGKLLSKQEKVFL